MRALVPHLARALETTSALLETRLELALAPAEARVVARLEEAAAASPPVRSQLRRV